MEESPVDLSEIVWVDGHRDRQGLDPAHRNQIESRERANREQRLFGRQRDRIIGAVEPMAGSARDLFALVGRLIHDLRPIQSVRHHSEVRHFAWYSFEELTGAIGRPDPTVLKAGRVRLRCDPGRLEENPRRYELDARLRLPVSRPDLPVRVVIEPWWRNRSAVTLRLRPSHRWRYPRRYFEAAHSVVSKLTAAPTSPPFRASRR